MAQTIELRIKYFAALRQWAGQSEECIQTNAQTAADLYTELSQKYDFALPLERIRVAVNHAFCEPNRTLKHQDLVVFIPPVAGG